MYQLIDNFCNRYVIVPSVIEVDDIAQISEGCYEVVEKVATRKGFKVGNLTPYAHRSIIIHSFSATFHQSITYLSNFRIYISTSFTFPV